MLTPIFPSRFDNDYRGHKLALWLYVPIVLVKVGISLSALFDGYNMLRSADGIPLDTFGNGGAEALVYVTALLGLSHFLLAALCLLALIRYRAMIPLLYVLLLLEFVGKKWILLVHPIIRTGGSPSVYINLVLLALLLAGLALSFWSQANRATAPGPSRAD